MKLPSVNIAGSALLLLLGSLPSVTASAAAVGPGKRDNDELGTARASTSAPRPQIHTLPSLREQAVLVDGWTAERAAGIPDMLARRGVDAWIVSLFVFVSVMTRRKGVAPFRYITMFKC